MPEKEYLQNGFNKTVVKNRWRDGEIFENSPGRRDFSVFEWEKIRGERVCGTKYILRFDSMESVLCALRWGILRLFQIYRITSAWTLSWHDCNYEYRFHIVDTCSASQVEEAMKCRWHQKTPEYWGDVSVEEAAGAGTDGGAEPAVIYRHEILDPIQYEPMLSRDLRDRLAMSLRAQLAVKGERRGWWDE